MSFDKNSWCILSPIEQSIKRKIEAVGVPLKDWNISINYGIKTGCNEAFIIDGATKDALIAQDPKSAEIIRPILRGRDIKRYSYDFADKWLIATHNGTPTQERIKIEDYPAVKMHLDSYYAKITKRDDQGDTPYNLRCCAYWDDFSKPKIVWAETIKIYFKGERNYPRFAYIKDPKFLDKTTFFMPVNEKNLYLIGILNSRLFEYLFDNSYSNILGIGSRGFQKNLFELLPVIERNNINDKEIKEIEKILLSTNNLPSIDVQNELDDIVFRLYHLTKEEVDYVLKETNVGRFLE